jgi:hypothetical protein
MKKRFFTFFFIFLFAGLISCNNNPAAHSLTKTGKNTSAAGSKKIGDKKEQKLSSILYELAISQDHEYFAKQHDIELDNKDRVRVYILFEPTSSAPDRTKIIKDHKIIIEKSSADLTRGLVPVDHLISLSEEPVIRSIRLPDRLIKAREINP